MFATLLVCVSARRAAPASRSRGVFDVLEYGADPSGHADSSDAIQAAVHAAMANAYQADLANLAARPHVDLVTPDSPQPSTSDA